VEFISGPVSEAHLPDGGCITRVVSAAHMLAAAQEKLSFADLILFAAAVADYRPISRATEKLPKQGTHLLLELEPTPDIAATLCARKRAGQTAIGFALQTHDGEAKAREKLLSKRLDGIVLNTPTSLGADSGSFTWIDRRSTEPWGELDKAECARHIFEKAAALALQIDPAR
jgi:phosphopantothenoylcysteine decarboxylase/phosphopantothenate--cysteine ligase